MKKILLSLLLLTSVSLVACGNQKAKTTESTNDSSSKVVKISSTSKSQQSSSVTSQTTQTSTTQTSSTSSSESQKSVVPSFMQGTWKSKADQGDVITYVITADTITASDKTYKITGCDEQSGNSYVLTWNVDAFTAQYGADSLGPGPQPFVFVYNKANNTLESGVTFYKQ
jgi:hypothetical protein